MWDKRAQTEGCISAKRSSLEGVVVADSEFARLSLLEPLKRTRILRLEIRINEALKVVESS